MFVVRATGFVIGEAFYTWHDAVKVIVVVYELVTRFHLRT